MNSQLRIQKVSALAMVLALGGCNTQMLSQVVVDASLKPKSTEFPYHPLVYHLDLSILAYQLYGQSLVWPFDPYYEEFSGGSRNQFMQKVRSWASQKGAEQAAKPPRLGGYRGPGVLGGFSNNTSHDPIIYSYSQLYPWSHTISQAAGQWTEYLTPTKITGPIGQVFMCYRRTGAGEGSVLVDPVVSTGAKGGRDVLLAFEGGTGDKGEAGRSASQSLMGYVLLRHLRESKGYDVHIAFRGSRSGSAGRAIKQALSDRNAKGNPDWITDLGYNRISPAGGGAHITNTGTVHRGFAKSMKSILPNLFGCLNKTSGLAKGQAPNNIFVTGHSLGGALAQQFVGSVLLGNLYGPLGNGGAMPSSLRNWPWKQIKLISYSAPRVGDAKWAATLTKDGLSSVVFSTDVVPIDVNALAPSNPEILRQLGDTARPAGYRVLISNDPVTTEKVAGGKHVGQTVYVNRANIASLGDPSSHEPIKVRGYMLKTLNDPAIPPVAWRYQTDKQMNPQGAGAKRGSSQAFTALSGAIERYYSQNKVRFDLATYQKNVVLFQSLRGAQ